MATTSSLLAPLLLLFLLPHTSHAATANLTDILVKQGPFTTFLRLLNTTQVIIQIDNQVNTSSEGITVFAPTDNAFQSLKPGAINNLTQQQQVQLVLYHVLPKFYTWDNFQTVSNPVQTEASGNNGSWVLKIFWTGVQQANVSTGVVETPITNAISLKSPLAVYQVEMVLLPEELFSKPPAPAAGSPTPPPAAGSPTGSKKNSTSDAPSAADGPVADGEKKKKNRAVVLKNLWASVAAAVSFGTMFLL